MTVAPIIIAAASTTDTVVTSLELFRNFMIAHNLSFISSTLSLSATETGTPLS